MTHRPKTSRRTFARSLFVLTLLAALVGLAGCGGGQATTATESAQTDNPTTATNDEAATDEANAEGTTPQRDPIEVSAPVIEDLEIPYEKFVLDNGLTLVVHEDHKAPIVAVNVWYHVGSKNERPGRTGFAHLFEHLMFQGSDNHKGEFFEPFERVGATDMNGTTNEDRTNYFENVPTPALDLALWMESDRMGHFESSITQALLDEQRGVVQNEKRQGLNQPYGKVRELIPAHTFPQGHPYSWSVIGSMEDLDAASLDDVKTWFETWYGAANATLVVSGDVDPQDVKQRVEKYFGDIAPGPELERPAPWVAPMEGTTRLAVGDAVPQARVYKIWNVPQEGTPEAAHLDLATTVLTSGKTSRLYKRLVYEDQLATTVSAYIAPGEIASQVMIVATARPDVKLADVEKALDEELARFVAEGPTQEEVERARTQFLAGFVNGLERIGGFGGKSDILARAEVYGGSPDSWEATHGHIRAATAESVGATVKEWLDDGVFVLEVHPNEKLATDATSPTDTPPRNLEPALGPDGKALAAPMVADPHEREFAAGTGGADRSKLPDVGATPALELPDLQRATLTNGMQVILAERHEAPLVRMKMLFDAGYAADQFAAPGVAKLALSMLDEGTDQYDALEISEMLDTLGASVGTGSSLDMSSVSLSTLTASLQPALEIFAELVQRPAFPDNELERLRKQTLAGIQQEQAQPIQTALRLLGPMVYGESHAYGTPLTGSGTLESVAAITRADLQKFHDTWIRPDQATLIVVGDTTLDALVPQLEAAFAGWQAPATPVPDKNLASVAHIDASRIVLIDKPGAEQSLIIASHVAPPREMPSDIAIAAMNEVLGGSFTSRINMNLREDKHWSYGARSFLWDTQGQRLFVAYGGVQTDKTAESLIEFKKELSEILDGRPATAEELAKVQKGLTLTLPGDNETTGEVLGSIEQIVTYDLPDSYYDEFVQRVAELEVTDLQKAASDVVRPEQLTWIVVGDLSKIEDPVRKLGFGPVSVTTAK